MPLHPQTARLAPRRAALPYSLSIHRGLRAAFRAIIGLLVCGAAAAVPPEATGLLYPVDVAVSPDGEIYVADLEAAALLRWDGAGFEVVVRGEGLPRTPLFGIRHIAPAGDGTVVASDPATMALYRISPDGGIEAIPDDERFVTPWGVAIAPDRRVLVVDRVTQRLRRVGPNSVEDLAEIHAPRAILAEADGSLHVLTDRNVLRMEDGAATAVVESPPFEFPHDFVRAPDGGFFVSDGYARCIWRVSAEGRVSMLARGDPLISPQGLALADDGGLLVADAHARTIFRVSLTGEIHRLGE